MQPVYTAVKAKVLPFEELSLDMLGSMKAFPWTNAKKAMDIFSVILGMLTIEARLGVKIMKISVDAGSNYLVENLDPEGRRAKGSLDC